MAVRRSGGQVGGEAFHGLVEFFGGFVGAGFDFTADAVDEVFADVGQALELASHLGGGGEVGLIAATGDGGCGGRGAGLPLGRGVGGLC